ncbi:PREDICTED: BSD domain-containing protein 1-like isoform X2 [Populus euphratica]|uniref:BSD domain-containing protein 1-like isoform X2 n=1 Tax=Populus euphratica TaxID=75702 RepID=A0AAJ6T8B7_POPEU|nr:PREDICTED: BSD domain-containing protein 1-like isoform X2 [Populus euphratica]
MNFFKAVFADDPTPPDSPKSPPPSSENPNPDPPTQNSTWSFGSLIQTLATKSESVIEIYKKDLEEFGSGLKNESAIIRDVASRAVHDLPASFEASAAVAQESVGQAIGGIGSSMWKSTAQIISQGRDSILASDHDHDRDRDLLLSNTDTNRSSLGKQYSRFDAQVCALQCDFDTYCSEPEDKEDYEKWKSRGFVIDEKKEEIERFISENGVIREIYGELVPNRVDDESFWSRFFYRMFKLNQAEEARALLVKRAISGDEEEDLSWDFDDDKEECDGLLSKGGESTVNVVDAEKGSVDGMIVENVADKERVGVDGSEDKLEEKVIVGVDISEDKLKEKVVVVEGEGEGEGNIVQSCKDNVKLEEKAVVGKGEGDNGKSCKDSDKLEEKVVEGKGGDGESPKDSDVSVVSSKSLAEEDLEWDEIEDIGSNDESKGEAVGSRKSAGSSTSRVDLHKQLSAAEEEEDFSWDIEDEDDARVK